jgi:hypothetical protein
VEPEEQFQREAAGRRAAIAGAVASVVLQVASAVLSETALRGAPTGESRSAVLARPGFHQDHALELISARVLAGAGILLLALPLTYLYREAKARQAEVPAVAGVTAFAGPALLAVGVVASQVLLTLEVAEYLRERPGDFPAARKIGSTSEIIAAQALYTGGVLALGFAFVLISLHAMRVGLLTRFMGVLGIIVGVLVVLPIGSPQPIVQWFWLGALAYLFAGRWPGGVPPAWKTGRAEPWPSAREVREQREREQARTQAAAEETEPRPETASAPERPHPVSRKRRRKRRR